MNTIRVGESRSVARGTIGARVERVSEGGRRGRVSRLRLAAMLAGTTVLVAAVTVGSATAGKGQPAVDTGSLNAIAQITGATTMWDNGFTGQGIGVAVIDTGVAKVPGLDRAGKVVDGPDFSFDSQNPKLVNTDAFGHGTHVAGIIAGSDAAPNTSVKGCANCTSKSVYSDTTKFEGIAPDAKIVNVKVGAYDGAADVSQMIAAIDWVVQHRNDPGMNIRVLNLSYGTDSTNPATTDPLAFAVEQAWNAGIVVVAAGGNEGQAVGLPLADPAYSPAIIAVGSTDPMGTLDTTDDVIPDFAQHGTDDRGIDVTAPGVSVTSLRVPNGFVDQNVTTGKVGTRFQRASGTSQSTAVVSGLAALLLSKFPNATPTQVKGFLEASAVKMGDHKGNQHEFTGAGVANLAMAATSPLKDLLSLVSGLLLPKTTGNGTGSLEGARGTYHVSSNGVELQGEQDIFGHPWFPVVMSVATKVQLTWLGGWWNGSNWTNPPSLFSNTWTSSSWQGSDWSGARWSGARWSDSAWDGARWSGARWSGARWSDGSWDGARWSGARWSDGDWG